MKLRIQNLLLSLQNFIRQKLLLHVIEAETLDGRSETFAGNALLPIQENRLTITFKASSLLVNTLRSALP